MGSFVWHVREGSLDGPELASAYRYHPFSGNGRRFRVLDVVPFEEEDESPFGGLLRVEAA